MKVLKRSRWLLLKKQNRLTDDLLLQPKNLLFVSPKLREVYWLKEVFYTFISCRNQLEAKKNLNSRNLYIGTVDLEVFTKCFEMINRWQPYILRAFSLGYTNGFAEGCNNWIKILKRSFNDVRNFIRIRNRILHMMAV